MRSRNVLKWYIFLWIFLRVLPVNPDLNVALGRPATQSSTYSNPTTGTFVAQRSVDGNFNTNMFANSCSHTNDSPGRPNWWMVDLGQPLHITHVVIAGRDDASFVNRLDYFIVGVANGISPPVRGCYVLCGQYPYPAIAGANHSVTCNSSSASGRYVIVQQPSNGVGYLSFCEVQVFAGAVRNTNHWKRQKDVRLMTNGAIVAMSDSAVRCVNECKVTAGCDSINYHPVDNMCELNFLPRGATQCDLISATGWSWWFQIYEFI